MGMDALTNAILDALTKAVLPRLEQALQKLELAQPAVFEARQELRTTLHEVHDLLSLWQRLSTRGNSGNSENPKTLPDIASLRHISLDPGKSGDQDAMSDAEARRLLAEMDAPISSKQATTPDAMSDEEARQLLAEMDTPLQSPVSAPAEPDDGTLAMLAAIEDESLGGNPMGDRAIPDLSSQHQPDSMPDSDEVIGEIEEFANNDFASDPDMMRDFITNSEELMQTLDATILELEQSPDDKETIESIFRAAHTLKGAAGMFGFKAIERVMHGMENLFDKVRKGKLRPDSNTIDVVFQGLDTLRVLLAAVRQGQPSGTKTGPISHLLNLASNGQYRKADNGVVSRHRPTPTSPEHPLNDEAGAHRGPDQIEKKRDTSQTTIRVDLERLDALVNLVGELVIDRTRFASIEESIRTTQPHLPIASNMSETVQLFGRHMNEIHEIIMKIRMVPVSNAFNKFPRIVRDLARQLGKEIDLAIDGEDTELDKTLVEQIADPLIHLIRNSCDHGIEIPTIRQQLGKNTTGQVCLSAQQEGNHIIITIKDDGKGLDVQKIRQKGVERGLIKDDAVMEPRDIFNLIFEPGFSTAEKVTTVSGRGVGMDVVRKQISKLKGIIDLDSTPGHGTTTTIRLPLTLAIVQSLLVEVQNELFAIPLSTVIESVRIKPDEIQHVGDIEVIRRHGKVLPLLHLNDSLDLAKRDQVCWYDSLPDPSQAEQHLAQSRFARRHERLYVVIVGSGDRRFGIVVDQLLQQQDMVIKSMGPLMKSVPCVAGGAVLGNGRVVLVLDIQDLEDRFRSKNRSTPLAA